MTPDALLLAQQAELQRQAQFKNRILCCTVAGCLAGGAGAVRKALEHEVRQQGRTGDVEICGSGCMGLCSEGPLVRSSAADAIYTNVTPADAPAVVSGSPIRAVTQDHPFFAGQRRVILANSGHIDPERIADYIATGGYQSLLRAVTEMTRGQIVAEVRRSGLRGRGGAGYPAGLKWELVARQPSREKHVVCNADEGDPGAFMNRAVLEGDPHRVLEGMAIAGRAVGAHQGFIYVRGESPLDGGLEYYDGKIRIVDAAGNAPAESLDPTRYFTWLGEASEDFSFIKFPFYRPMGYPQGYYRVGPLARLNVARFAGTERADRELREFKQRGAGAVCESFHYHLARLIEMLHAAERIEQLMADPDLFGESIQARASLNRRESVGSCEAPRGTLFHHYWVDDNGLMTKADLLIATGQNNQAMNLSVDQAARHFLKRIPPGTQPDEGILNRIEAAIRCYDPCLSCSTHALGQMPMIVEWLARMVPGWAGSRGRPDADSADRVRQPSPLRRWRRAGSPPTDCARAGSRVSRRAAIDA